MNRDTLYSGAVFDLDAGPVTITLPNAGKRFIVLQVINEDANTRRCYTEACEMNLDRRPKAGVDL